MMRCAIFSIIFGCLVLLLTSCNELTSGGTGQGGNATVSGIIHTPSGLPSRNDTVYIADTGYTWGSAGKTIYTTQTDSIGFFSVEVAAGTWRLSSRADSGIVYDLLSVESGEDLMLGTIRQDFGRFAAVDSNIGGGVSGASITIPGTPWHFVDDGSTAAIMLPFDSLSMIITSNGHVDTVGVSDTATIISDPLSYYLPGFTLLADSSSSSVQLTITNFRSDCRYLAIWRNDSLGILDSAILVSTTSRLTTDNDTIFKPRPLSFSLRAGYSWGNGFISPFITKTITVN